MTLDTLAYSLAVHRAFSYILVTKMLEKLQLSVCPLREDGGAKRLHDLLNCHSLAGQLVFGRTARTL